MLPPERLGPAAVLQSMATTLPIHQKGDATSDMSTSLDCIGLFVHACMVNLDFTLVGFEKDRNIEAECARRAPHLPSRWNRSLHSHGFVYTHDKSSVRVVLKVNRLRENVEIRGQATGDDHSVALLINPHDYVKTSQLPLRITLTADGDEDRSDLVQKLKALFVSEDRIKELASLLKADVIQQIHATIPENEGTNDSFRRRVPPPEQPSRPDEPVDTSILAGLPEPAAPHPYPAPEPLAEPRNNPAPAADFPPPDFEDEYEVNRPAHGPTAPARAGFGGLGHNDLYPAGMGPHDPIAGSFASPHAHYQVGPDGLRRPAGVGPFQPPLGRGGGMHPTFDDPIFQGPWARGGPGGTFGGQIPPGARWDPYGPGGGPRFPGGRGGGGSGFGGGFGGGDII